MKKLFIFILVPISILTCLVIVFAVYFYNGSPDTYISANGRIEGRITTLTPKSSGKVIKINYDEGQLITKGTVLVVLADKPQTARVQAVQSQLDALNKRLQAANMEIKTLKQQIILRIDKTKFALQEMISKLKHTHADYLQAEKDTKRYVSLAAKRFVSKQLAEEAKLEQVKTYQTYQAAMGAKKRAEKNLQLAYLEQDILEGKKLHRDALIHDIKQTQAILAGQQSYLDNFIIRSPITGTILTRTIELGEYVNAGTPLFTLVDLKHLYIKIYIPEPQIGKIVLNQKAKVTVNSYPNRHFLARVSEISQQAEFTPKNVETKEERAKLVFAVKLLLFENPGNVLKPGMPADAQIKIMQISTTNKE